MNILDKFYYLAPLWFLVELFVWPDFRAGLVVGQSAWANALFYGVEGGIGAALFFKLPHAQAGALLENIAYLVFAVKFVLITSYDITLSIAGDTALAETMARNYTASLPGILYSMFHVGLKISSALKKGGPPAP